MTVDPLALSQEILFTLQERVRNNPDDLPAGQLLAFGRDLVKLEQARLERAPTEDNEERPSVLELVRESNLPDERKKELLLTERERLEDELEQVRFELEEL